MDILYLLLSIYYIFWIYYYIRFVWHLCIYLYNDKICILTIFFIISVFIFKVYVQMWFFFWLAYDSSWNDGIIFIFEVKYLYCVLFHRFTNFVHGIITFVYIVLIFYVIKCQYLRHWIITRKMFFYFCFELFFKIIFYMQLFFLINY